MYMPCCPQELHGNSLHFTVIHFTSLHFKTNEWSSRFHCNVQTVLTRQYITVLTCHLHFPQASSPISKFQNLVFSNGFTLCLALFPVIPVASSFCGDRYKTFLMYGHEISVLISTMFHVAGKVLDIISFS